MKLFNLFVLVCIACAVTFVISRYDIAGLSKLKLVPQGAAPEEQEAKKPPPAAPGPKKPSAGNAKAIRIATIDLTPLTQKKTSNRRTVGYLSELVRQFDLVAIQGIRAQTKSVLVEFVEQINSKKRNYNFAVSPRIGADPEELHCAFLFDQDTILIDLGTLCTVADPTGRFRTKPLVAAFQAAKAQAKEAFTFTLINVRVDPGGVEVEHELLTTLFRAVRDDERGEDDIILLGNLGASIQDLGPLAEVPNMIWPVADVPTTTGGTEEMDNLLFDRRATTEFTGRAGVVNIIRQFDISVREAQAVTGHLPVWAEFSIFEGGYAGNLATHPTAVRR